MSRQAYFGRDKYISPSKSILQLVAIDFKPVIQEVSDSRKQDVREESSQDKIALLQRC